jgi:hypothetical protein
MGAFFQIGDVKFPDACAAATRSQIGEAAGDSILGSNGTRRWVVNPPLKDICGRTAVGVCPQRCDKHQPEEEQEEPGEGVARCRPSHGELLQGSPRRCRGRARPFQRDAGAEVRSPTARWDAPRRYRNPVPYPPCARSSASRGANKKPQPNAEKTTARTILKPFKASFSERRSRFPNGCTSIGSTLQR